MQSLSELHASSVFEAATSPSRAEASGPAGGPAACRAALRPRPRPFLDVIYDAQHHHIAEIHRPRCPSVRTVRHLFRSNRPAVDALRVPALRAPAGSRRGFRDRARAMLGVLSMLEATEFIEPEHPELLARIEEREHFRFMSDPEEPVFPRARGPEKSRPSSGIAGLSGTCNE